MNEEDDIAILIHAANLMAEICRGEHEGSEMMVCKDFLDKHNLWDCVDESEIDDLPF